MPLRTQNKVLEPGQVVEVFLGTLAGIRGVLIDITNGGRAIIRLDEQGVLLVTAAENIAFANTFVAPRSQK